MPAVAAVNGVVPPPLIKPVILVTPVPPYPTGIVFPFQVPLLIVPTVVILDDPAAGAAPIVL